MVNSHTSDTAVCFITLIYTEEVHLIHMDG